MKSCGEPGMDLGIRHLERSAQLGDRLNRWLAPSSLSSEILLPESGEEGVVSSLASAPPVGACEERTFVLI